MAGQWPVRAGRRPPAAREFFQKFAATVPARPVLTVAGVHTHVGQNIAALGTESAFEVLARAQALAARGRSIINLGIGQPDFPTPPHIVEAACRALVDGHHGYTPANGIRELREAICADAARRLGVTVDPGQVVVVPGGKVTMSFAMLMFGRPGAEILHPDPGFPIYRSLIEFSGAAPVGYPLRAREGDALAADEVLARITPRTRLVIINSPANPTGGVASPAELDRLVAGLARHPEVFVLSDEIYARLIYGRARHVSLLAAASLRDRLIILDGLSKTYAMTGWRLGWGIWPGELAEAATRLAINLYSCVNAATQHAAIAALTGPQDAVDRMVATFAERRAVIVEGLNGLPGVRCGVPGGAFYAFADITGTGFSARELQDRWLDELGVATIAGTSFGARGEGHVRLSYATSLEDIREAMHRLGGWLCRHARLRRSA